MKQYIFLSIFLIASFFSFSLKAQEQEESIKTETLNPAEDEVNILYGTQKYRRFTGNTSAVQSEDLQKYPAVLVMEALTGRLPGVFIQQSHGQPGGISNTSQGGLPYIGEDFTVYVRGAIGAYQDGNTNTNYLILIDGVERNVNFYNAEQIEEIRVLKDPVSKAFYGGRMSNGVILITTKKGDLDKRKGFDVKVQKGWKQPTRLPKFLNSYDFALKYNEALTNDGLTSGLLSDQVIQGYKAGNKPIQYPNVDFYGDFLNDMMQMTRANIGYTGGNKQTSYFVHSAYQKEGGLEKFGEHKTRVDLINLQGNITSHYSDFIIVRANMAGIFKTRDYPSTGLNWGEFSSRRPNAYPIFVDVDKKRYGGASGMLDNPMALMVDGGYTRENLTLFNTDIGIEFKLDGFIKGLSIKPSYTYDFYHRQDLNKRNTTAIWSTGTNFNDQGVPVSPSSLRTEAKASSQALGTELFQYRWSFNNLVSFERQFGKHEISADYQYFMSMQFDRNRVNDYKRLNNAIRLNYTFDKRYTFEGAILNAGSDRFASNKTRFCTLPSFGVGWLLSEEAFLKGSSLINFLKLNASWGIIGDGDYYAYRWRQEWDWYDRSYTWSSGNSTPVVSVSRLDAPNLTWQKNRQIDINLEAVIANKLSGKLTYFNFLQYDLISTMYSVIPHLIGWERYYPSQNYAEVALQGTEVELRYSESFNNLKLSVGGHLTYGITERKKWDENPDPNYNTIGKPHDINRGFRWDGYYTQADIDKVLNGTMARPSYMDYKLLKVGDIKYKDLNGDGILDRYDYEIIGNTNPRMMYGIDLNVQYGTKSMGKLELNLLFSGMGIFQRSVNNSYYQNFSTRKYSNVLIDGLPNGNPHPKITTGSMTNDTQGSDYWIANGSFMKLKNAVLSYTLPENMLQSLKMKDLKLSFYGTNLLTFSQIKELDPESLNAGLDRWPLFRTFAIGLSANF